MVVRFAFVGVMFLVFLLQVLRQHLDYKKDIRRQRQNAPRELWPLLDQADVKNSRRKRHLWEQFFLSHLIFCLPAYFVTLYISNEPMIGTIAAGVFCLFIWIVFYFRFDSANTDHSLDYYHIIK